MEVRRTTRTAAEAGWHESFYNLRATVPETGRLAIANLFRGTVAEYGPLEVFLMGALDEISESHPMVGRLARSGVICDFDERAAIEAMGRGACAAPEKVDLTIAPTLACNFDCPYCFEEHVRGKMSPRVQDDVVALAGRLLEASGARELTVAWFGGEPLLALDVISSLTGRLVELARRRGVTYDARIITNGYLLDGPTVVLLERLHVTHAEITLDGIGAAHDSTRHLAGGGATFDRIVENLSRPGLPLKVKLRHSVHAGNLEAMGEVRRFVEELACESGNDLRFHPMPLEGSQVARDRGSQVEMLSKEDCARIDLPRDIGLGLRAAGHLCCAQRLWEMAVDELGNLYKCQLEIGTPSRAFGTVHKWNPADPLATASKPDNLTTYLNTAAPVPDDECRECVWLPVCRGGCPKRRLAGERPCKSYKDGPERYVLAAFEHAKRQAPAQVQLDRTNHRKCV